MASIYRFISSRSWSSLLLRPTGCVHSLLSCTAVERGGPLTLFFVLTLLFVLVSR
jgi:hypothetical protein